MTSDLDTAYNALKATQDAPDIIREGADEASHEAADALARTFASNLWARAAGDEAEYRRLYDELAPKAMIMITAVVGVVGEMAEGKNNAQLDAFLTGVVRGQA